MARIYHRDQAGAPVLTYSASGSSAAHFEAFKTILKSCLVSGYGSIPGAGWELISESAVSLVLRNGTHSGYVCFQRESSVSTVVTVWLAATFSGVDASGKITGSGVRSGTAANSSPPQRLSVQDLVSYSASTTWSLVADAGTFVLSMSGVNFSTPAAVTTGTGSAGTANSTLYCGDDSGGDFICVGGSNTATVSAGGSYFGFGSGGFTALKFPNTGLLVDTAAITVAMPGTKTSSGSFGEYPADVVLPDVNLSPLAWVANAEWRRLRGMAVDIRIMGNGNGSAGMALGGPTLTTRTMSTVMTLGDGHGYLVGRTYGAQAITMLMTDNPEFW